MHAEDGAMLVVDGIGGKVDGWLAGWLETDWLGGSVLVVGMHVGGKEMDGGKGLLQMLEQSCIVTFMKQKQWHQLLSQWWVADSFWQSSAGQCQAQSKTRVRLPHES